MPTASGRELGLWPPAMQSFSVSRSDVSISRNFEKHSVKTGDTHFKNKIYERTGMQYMVIIIQNVSGGVHTCIWNWGTGTRKAPKASAPLFVYFSHARSYFAIKLAFILLVIIIEMSCKKLAG